MFLLIDKPAGITSHDVVARVRRITGERRVGHAGTLDPFATGLLIVGVSRESTKHLGEFLGQDKAYEATMKLGYESDTQDYTGTISPIKPNGPWPTKEDILAVFQQFTGQISQTPPMFSAKKIAGKKLYELAREGKTVERQPVQVTINSLTLISYDIAAPAAFAASCTSGTYIRTLAHDIGAALGTGAYLETLRRTSIGAISITQAIKLDELTPENWQSHAANLPFSKK